MRSGQATHIVRIYKCNTQNIELNQNRRSSSWSILYAMREWFNDDETYMVNGIGLVDSLDTN